jgi:L-alanine-DL-glutamate epimerase-like enolase superfamily enzyme
MEITDIHAILLSCPMPKGGDPPWQTCSDYGTVVQRNAVIVEVETDEGIIGYGSSKTSFVLDWWGRILSRLNVCGNPFTRDHD